MKKITRKDIINILIMAALAATFSLSLSTIQYFRDRPENYAKILERFNLSQEVKEPIMPLVSEKGLRDDEVFTASLKPFEEMPPGNLPIMMTETKEWTKILDLEDEFEMLRDDHNWTITIETERPDLTHVASAKAEDIIMTNLTEVVKRIVDLQVFGPKGRGQEHTYSNYNNGADFYVKIYSEAYTMDKYPDIVSIAYSIIWDARLAHPMREAHVMNFNLKTGEQYSYNDLFTETDTKESTYKAILVSGGFKDHTFSVTGYGQMIFTDDEILNVYFNPGNGPRIVQYYTLPWKVIEPYINPNGPLVK